MLLIEKYNIEDVVNNIPGDSMQLSTHILYCCPLNISFYILWLLKVTVLRKCVICGKTAFLRCYHTILITQLY